MKTKKLGLILLPLVVVCFFLAGFLFASGEVASEKAIQMSGSGWSLSVDKVPLTADVKSVVSVGVSKDVVGAQELSLVLNSLEECKAGKVDFKVNTVGLSCFKQLPLTEEEVKQGSVRPVNVVNSYACFDGSGRKVLHIYASRLIDAKGNSVWVDQNLTAGVLSVFLDEKWLETAVFPVVLDPVFGYDTAGASTDGGNNGGYLKGSNFTLSQQAVVTGFGACVSDSQADSLSWMALYNGSGLLLESNQAVMDTVKGWVNYTVTGTYILNPGEYTLAFQAQKNTYSIYYDAGGDSREENSAIWGTFPDPITWVNVGTHKNSLYMNYTVYVAPTVSPSPTISPVPTSGFGFDMNWLIFAFIVFGAVLCIIPARIFVVRIVVGFFGIILAVSQLQNTSLWFYPWSLVLWLFMSVCVVYSVWARTD